MFLEQGDGPLHCLVAEVHRPPLEGGGEGCLKILSPNSGAIAPTLIGQRLRVVGGAIAVDPVIDADPAGAEQLRDVGDGPASSGLQNGQGAAEQARIGSVSELLFESMPLGGGESESVHGAPQ